MPGHEAPPPSRPPESHGAVPAGEVDSMSTLLIAGLGVAVAAAIIAVIYVVMAGGNAGSPATPPPATTADADIAMPAPGQWTTTTEPSAGGGSDEYAMVASFEAVSSAAGAARPTLTARCVGGAADVYITWFMYSGDTDMADLQTQVDSGPAERDPWSISTDAQSTFFEGDARVLLQQWAASERLQARLSAPGQNPVAVTFDLSGLSDVLPAIGQACGWS